MGHAFLGISEMFTEFYLTLFRKISKIKRRTYVVFLKSRKFDFYGIYQSKHSNHQGMDILLIQLFSVTKSNNGMYDIILFL